jgi:hypothetical protein
MLGRFKIKDLFPEMVNNPNLLMFCINEEFNLCTKYMFEKHNKVVAAQAVLEYPGFHVYRILSQKNPNYKLRVKPRVKKPV